MFYGEKLISLRELNGLSRKELADTLKVTEQAVWQYENENSIPRIEILNQLRETFQVKSKYFFSASFLDEKISEEKVAFRTKDRDSRKKTKLELTYLNYLAYFIDYFEQYLDVPPAKITELRKMSSEIWSSKSHEILEKIEMIAGNTRTALKLTDNKELMFTLEKSGIFIVEKNFGSEIDAYSTVAEDGRPFIILGSIKKSAVRRNFDLAHELGHILLHQNVDMETLSNTELKEIENQANTFASCFLLPKEEFTADFLEMPRRSNPDSYIELKRKYLVSIVSLELRAYHLGLMSYQENRYFFGRLNKMGYKVFEPLDDKIVPVRPGKIKSMIQLIFDHHVLDCAVFLDTFHIHSSFVCRLFCLDEVFFSKYLELKKDYFAGVKVIEMDPFRSKERLKRG